MTEAYWSRVVSYSISEIKEGRTPNPDILCNSRVKFGAFYDFLESNFGGHFDRVASGHYARLLRPGTTGAADAGAAAPAATAAAASQPAQAVAAAVAGHSGTDHRVSSVSSVNSSSDPSSSIGMQAAPSGRPSHVGAANSCGDAASGGAAPAQPPHSSNFSHRGAPDGINQHNGTQSGSVNTATEHDAATSSRAATSTAATAATSDVQLALTPDEVKDQTYFLAHLTQKQLQRVLFPLGPFTKPQVSQRAKE